MFLLFSSRLTALCFPCITQFFLIQRLRTENLLVRQKVEMLEQESSDLADRLIQVRQSACWDPVFHYAFHLIAFINSDCLVEIRVSAPDQRFAERQNYAKMP